MKSLFLCLIVIVCLVSCQNQSEHSITSDSVIADKHVDTTVSSNDSIKTIVLENGAHCFSYMKNQDTIMMRLILYDTMVSGDLVYNLYQKDRNKGTFKGSLINDTLFANYTFLSEGARSVREVVFLVKGNILLPGNGSMKEQKNRLVFSHKQDISFDDNFMLKPVDCGAMNIK